MIILKFLLGLVLALYLQTAEAYDQNICCELAKSKGAFIDDVPPPENQTCGQNYLKSQPAAPSL
jgi:hypothetical protein